MAAHGEKTWPPPAGRARGYRRSGSPLGAHLRDDSCVTNPDPSPSTTTSTSDRVVLTQAIALVPSEAIALSSVPTGRHRQVWAVVGSAGGLVAAGVATVLLLLSPGPAPAYAGWTAVPAAASQAAISTALKTCGAMNFGRNSGRRLPAPVLSEARGRYVAVVSIYHGQAAACVTDGPDGASQSGFTSFSAPTAGHIAAPVMYGSNAPGFPGSWPQRVTAFRRQLIAKLCAGLPTRLHSTCMARGIQNARGDGHVTVAYGRAGTGVTQLAFELPHRPAVQATVQHGWYFAWWPWTVWPSSARVTSNSGTASTPIRDPGGRP